MGHTSTLLVITLLALGTPWSLPCLAQGTDLICGKQQAYSVSKAHPTSELVTYAHAMQGLAIPTLLVCLLVHLSHPSLTSTAQLQQLWPAQAPLHLAQHLQYLLLQVQIKNSLPAALSIWQVT